MTERPMRVGIIGTGRIGVDGHVPQCRQAGAELVALADVVPGRAARFAEQLDVPHAFDDYRALLALPEMRAESERHIGVEAHKMKHDKSGRLRYE